MFIILEYGIFRGIFLEYSIKCKTSCGGVKFNQAFLWVLNFGEVGEILENFQNFMVALSFLGHTEIFHSLKPG